MRIGLVGGGDMAESYWGAAIAAGDRPFGLVTRSTKTAVVKQAGAAGVPVFHDVDALIRMARPGDAVVIAHRHAAHATAALLALSAGLHVLCEKPPATSLTDLARVRAAAEHLGQRQVFVACPVPEAEVAGSIAEGWRRNAAGPVMTAMSRLDVPGPPRSNWYYSAEAVGGASLDTLIYALARVLLLFGAPARVVGGYVGRTLDQRHNLDGGVVFPDVDDHSTILLEYGNSRIVTVQSGWFYRRPIDRIEIDGRHHQLVCDYMTGTLTLASGSDLSGEADSERVIGRVDHPHTAARKWRFFQGQVQQGNSAYEASLLATEIILAMIEGCPEKLALIPALSHSEGLMATQRTISD